MVQAHIRDVKAYTTHHLNWLRFSHIISTLFSSCSMILSSVYTTSLFLLLLFSLILQSVGSSFVHGNKCPADMLLCRPSAVNMEKWATDSLAWHKFILWQQSSLVYPEHRLVPFLHFVNCRIIIIWNHGGKPEPWAYRSPEYVQIDKGSC